LTLPARLVTALGLPFRTVGTARLADGSLVTLRKFETRVSWFGVDKDVYALEAESVPLVGMSLLSGCDLSIRVEAGGEVRLEPIRRR
jgi:predicted aspartyl protease